MNKYKWIFLILFCFSGIVSAANTITKITVLKTVDTSRLFISYDHSAKYKIFSLSNPERVIIDLEKIGLTASLKKLNLKDTNIKTIRTSNIGKKNTRIVIETKTPINYKVLSRPQDLRVVLDLYTVKKIPKPIVATPIIAAPVPPKIFTVVIDAGHGGKDPGATGWLGTREKNVVLAISLQLAELINREPNMRAVLTRRADYFVPLRGRLKLARKGKADLFVAIHADSFFNNNSNGVSIYALSQRGATSEAARWLAKRDNTSELNGLDLDELSDQSHVLRSVLIDLAQTATIRDSIRVGNILLDSLERVTKLHYNRVEQAPFVVLKSPDIPSILIETGFISNPREELRLRNPTYQTQIAQAIYKGILGYSKKYAAVDA